MPVIPLRSSCGISLQPAAVPHAAALAALLLQERAHLQRYLPALGALVSIEAARLHLAAAEERARHHVMFEWHLFDGEVLCGAIRLKNIDRDDRKAQVGYFLGSGFVGKGIVTSSMRSVIAFCFDTLALNRLELRCAAGNRRSMAVAERLGFTHEGVMRQDEFLNGEFVDQHVYGLLRSDFKAAQDHLQVELSRP